MLKEHLEENRQSLREYALSEGGQGLIGLAGGDPPFNNRIRKQRKALGLTHEQLGNQLGISGSYLAHIESLRVYPNTHYKEI